MKTVDFFSVYQHCEKVFINLNANLCVRWRKRISDYIHITTFSILLRRNQNISKCLSRVLTYKGRFLFELNIMYD